MTIEKLDKQSRDLLAYLNTNSNLSYVTLADVFNQHYRCNLQEALNILYFLENKGLVKLKTDQEEKATMIQVTHLGVTYEQYLLSKERERRKKLWSERCWNIITLIISAVISIIISLIIGR